MSSERSAELLAGQKATRLTEPKKTRTGMLTRFHGSEWTEEYIHGVLFDLDKNRT